jgi:3-methyladenine DNA glycosylase AlkD
LTSVPIDALVAELDAGLRAAADPRRAEHERAYLKSARKHYGTSVPAIRAVAKGVGLAHPDLDHDRLLALTDALWAQPAHEHRMVAVELLAVKRAVLGPADLGRLEPYLRTAGTWALVDGLAPHVAGAIVERHPAETAATLDAWATDADVWLRRAALLALLVPLRRGGGDFERFGRYADAMLDEREFFIRKAIGWVLRDTAKRRPDLVYSWLLPRVGRASGVTLREALKPLSPEQRAALERKTARQPGQPARP